MVSTAEAKFTRAEYMLLPEGLRAELLDGVLVKDPSPSGWHQVLAGRIHMTLMRLVGTRRVVESPIDFFVDEWNVLQPDVLVLPEGSPISPGDPEVGTPVLVVEVLSPTTASRDRDVKVGIYLAAGVREVWLVDPESETAEIHTRAGVTRFESGESPESGAVEGFDLDLAALFRT